MKIDWKTVCRSTGYISLKNAYIQDVRKAEAHQRKHGHGMRDKEEFLRQFKWVISRAKHYAHHKNTTIDVILYEWESKRDYWWLNYYQDARQPKFYTHKHKPLGLRGNRNYLKRAYRNDPVAVKQGMKRYHEEKKGRKEISDKSILKSLHKPRWDNERKKRMKRMKF